MFDIGWPELLVVAVLTLLVVGPKDLPVVLRTVGKYVGQVRALGREFTRTLEDVAKEAELDDVVKTAKAATDISNPKAQIEKFLAEEVADPINKQPDTSSPPVQNADSSSQTPEKS